MCSNMNYHIGAFSFSLNQRIRAGTCKTKQFPPKIISNLVIFLWLSDNIPQLIVVLYWKKRSMLLQGLGCVFRRYPFSDSGDTRSLGC